MSSRAGREADSPEASGLLASRYPGTQMRSLTHSRLKGEVKGRDFLRGSQRKSPFFKEGFTREKLLNF